MTRAFEVCNFHLIKLAGGSQVKANPPHGGSYMNPLTGATCTKPFLPQRGGGQSLISV